MTQLTGNVPCFEDYLRRRRMAILDEVDGIERLLNIRPRTAELRREVKQERLGNAGLIESCQCRCEEKALD